ncbi:bile acid:sodium symporter [Oceanimonas sp. CHS3-5]|uniref:bile acid:sodium symporter n=1 Tax=Oceanimonas sp. CHS3-5 TaxID=3068186 RepID=UPI00273FA1BB|nr:bile acid:sodium symporter [Oceanimonas sp. CHS3-5]MDP5290990.1 bile acid:sodium symporter [Oceanimonas sp. CHS3-5]
MLPGGLCAAIILALLLPGPGVWLAQWQPLPWLVAVIFLVNGLQTQVRELRPEAGFGRVFGLALVISLLLSPLLGALLYYYSGLAPGLALGLLVVSVVPPTLSSCVVLTRLSGGNAQWSLFMTLGLNLLGIVTIPLMLSLLIGSSGELSPWPLLHKLSLMVLLPFVLGILLRLVLGARVVHRWMTLVPTLSVVTTAWITLSTSRAALLALEGADLLALAAWSLLLHGLLLLLCRLAGSGLARPARLALMFTAAQKTTPVAVSVLVAMNAAGGLAVVACLVFHFLHMLADSLLASRIAARTAALARAEA